MGLIGWLPKYGPGMPNLFCQNVGNFRRWATFWIATKQVPKFFGIPTFLHGKFW